MPLPRPITAPTSQVGEVAVVRTPVSYKCGRGSNNKKLTPSLTLPAGEGTRVVARLVYIPHPLKTSSLRGNIHSARSNPEGISQLKPGVPPRPIIAPTSQVGEVAVVRASVSYKCGWGSDNKKIPPLPSPPERERVLLFKQGFIP